MRPANGAPTRPGPGWGWSARAEVYVWVWRRSSLLPPARQSIRSSGSPSSRLPLPRTARLSLLQTAVVKRRWSRAPAPSGNQSSRFSEAPQDPAEGRPGRCLSQRESRLGGPEPGEVGTRLDRRALACPPRTCWTRRKSWPGDWVRDQQPGRRRVAGR